MNTSFLFTFISPSPQKYKDLYVCVCIYTCMYIRTLQELYVQIYLPLNLVLKLPFYSDVELEAKSDPFGKVFLNWMLSIWERGIFTLKREDTASLLWIQQSYGPYPSVLPRCFFSLCKEFLPLLISNCLIFLQNFFLLIFVIHMDEYFIKFNYS